MSRNSISTPSIIAWHAWEKVDRIVARIGSTRSSSSGLASPISAIARRIGQTDFATSFIVEIFPLTQYSPISRAMTSGSIDAIIVVVESMFPCKAKIPLKSDTTKSTAIDRTLNAWQFIRLNIMRIQCSILVSTISRKILTFFSSTNNNAPTARSCVTGDCGSVTVPNSSSMIPRIASKLYNDKLPSDSTETSTTTTTAAHIVL